MPRLALTLGLLVILPSAANADLTVNNIGLYTGGSTSIDPNSTIVQVAFTGSTGVWVYGDAQTATNLKYSNGSSIPLYCIDLTHDNTLGSSYNLKTWTNPSSFSSDGLNRVAWAVENASLSGYGPAATQMLIWSVIDPQFKVINWNGKSSLQTAYNNLVTQMSSAYKANTNYLPGTQFWDATHAPLSNMNQDLAFIASPEPSTLVVAGLGALGLIGYGLRRRARSQV